MKHTFSIKKAINFGWQTFWKNPWFWVISWILVFGLSFSGSKSTFDNANKTSSDYVIQEVEQELVGFENTFRILQPNVLGMTTEWDNDLTEPSFPVGLMILAFLIGVPLVLTLLGYVILVVLVSQVMKLGWIHLILNATREKTLDYKIILSDVNLNKVLKLLGVNILYCLIILLGLLFFVIPGIYFLYKYSFASYFLIDKNTGVWESFKLSAQITKGNIWKLIGLSLVSILIMLLGLLLLIVGVIPASIIVSIAGGYVYVTLGDKLSKKEA